MRRKKTAKAAASSGPVLVDGFLHFGRVDLLRYELAQAQVLNALDDVLTDPTTIDVRVRAPAGTETHPAVVRDGAGTYHADVPITVSGIWRYRWVGTGAAAGAEEGFFEVRESSFPNPLRGP